MDVFVVLLCFMAMFVQVFGVEPSIVDSVKKVFVWKGKDAILPCSIDNLGEHKVVWTDQYATLLTLDNQRIIDDPRISVDRPLTKDWNLKIRNAEYQDRGPYECQINTNPVTKKTVLLEVEISARIVDELSSRDQTVCEGETLTLVCNTTGVPVPVVHWYKLPEEGTKKKKTRLNLDAGVYTLINSCGYTLYQEGIGTTGEVLIMNNVSRYCQGTYRCVAYNYVDPAVSRDIKVFVVCKDAPEVSLPTKRMGIEEEDYGENKIATKTVVLYEKKSTTTSTIMEPTTTSTIMELTPKVSNSSTMQDNQTKRPEWQDEKDHRNKSGEEWMTQENRDAQDHVTFNSVVYCLSLIISTLIQSWSS